MFFIAGLIAIFAGLFYAAGNGQLGTFGRAMCTYGDVFCTHPAYLLIGVGVAAAWGAFVSI
jgi:hypothetical protein